MTLICRTMVAAGLLTVSVASQAAEPSGLHVRVVEIWDQTGFDKPMVAARMIAPAGLKASGGIRWRVGLNECPAGHTYDWHAISADKLRAIQIAPTEQWGFSSMTGGSPGNGCPTSQLDNVKDFLTDWARRNRGAVRVLDYRNRPERAKPLQALARPMSVGGLVNQRVFLSGDLLIGYQVNGREVRESLAGTILVDKTQYPTYGMGRPAWSLFGFSMPVMAVRMPAGQLNFAHVEKIWASLKSDPAWQRRISKHQRVISRQNLESGRKIAEINRKSARELSEIRERTRRNQVAASDRMQRESMEVVRHTETWNSTAGDAVELPYTSHAWQLDDGSFYITDNGGFSPSDLGMSGKKLQRTQ